MSELPAERARKGGRPERALAVLLAFAAGLGVGVVARPMAGQWWRGVTGGAERPPQPLYPALWATQAAQHAELDAVLGDVAVVYLGDSVTAWMPVEQWLECDAGRVVGRAIPGDTTDGLLERISESFPRNVRVVVLMVGVNDLLAGAAPRDVAERVARAGDVLVERHGVERVLLESVVARQPAIGKLAAALNENLRTFADQHEALRYLDLAAAWRAAGVDEADAFEDGLHLSAAGVRARLAAEVELLREWMPELGLRLRVGVGAPE